jgi:mRNA-degrading endonuclease toxin of MazEF toxin-antitoxin module
MNTVGDREYVMISTETWIDVKDLTVEILKGKEGIEVRVVPRNADDGIEPLGVIRADYVKTALKRHNVIPFFPKGHFNDPNR